MPRGLKFLNFRKYGKFRTEISGLTEPSCRLFSSYFSATFPPILGVSSTIIAAAAAAAAAAAGGSPHPFSGQPVDLSVSFSAPCPTRWGPSKLQDDNMQIHHFLRTGKAQHRNAASHGCATKPFHPRDQLPRSPFRDPDPESRPEEALRPCGGSLQGEARLAERGGARVRRPG
ncbi:uncharacterized protein LOC127780146 [Oryza glaberrima]|uniref:Uncharacterized protein n=1 Tax=Oryza glaberrima TaxID=4538 RepID=I1Q9H0_ORYGL|nr:uncharacterized protein LOC127780146 [Oryza glaberrima]